jgi:ankyrin repeat protein
VENADKINPNVICPIRQDGLTALDLAAIKGHLGIMSLLLDKGANVDHQHKVNSLTDVLFGLVFGR